MGQVAVTINGRNYKINCEDGQEEHLTKLAAFINERAGELADAAGEVSDLKLMVMTSLVAADRVFDADAEIARLRAQVDQAKQSASTGADAAIAPIVEAIAKRIDDLAARLESA